MTLSLDQLQHAANMAHLDEQDVSLLFESVNQIIKNIQALKQVDTKDIMPMVHPLTETSHTRDDQVIDKTDLESLKKVAPEFFNGQYVVPNIMRGQD